MIYRAYIKCTIAVEFEDDGELELKDQAHDAFEEIDAEVLESEIIEVVGVE